MGCGTSKSAERRRSSIGEMCDIYNDNPSERAIKQDEIRTYQKTNKIFDDFTLAEKLGAELIHKNELPVPGWVMKTNDSFNNKIFVNVCGHGNVPKTTDWNHLPLIILSTDHVVDNKGFECIVYDVILNTADISAVLKLTTEKFCLNCQKIVTELNRRANLTLSSENISYPATKNNYKGSSIRALTPERIIGSTLISALTNSNLVKL